MLSWFWIAVLHLLFGPHKGQIWFSSLLFPYNADPFFTWGKYFLTGWCFLAPSHGLDNLAAFNEIAAKHVLAVWVATEYSANECKSRFFRVSHGSGNPENVSSLVFLKHLAGINVFWTGIYLTRSCARPVKGASAECYEEEEKSLKGLCGLY